MHLVSIIMGPIKNAQKGDGKKAFLTHPAYRTSFVVWWKCEIILIQISTTKKKHSRASNSSTIIIDVIIINISKDSDRLTENKRHPYNHVTVLTGKTLRNRSGNHRKRNLNTALMLISQFFYAKHRILDQGRSTIHLLPAVFRQLLRSTAVLSRFNTKCVKKKKKLLII